MAALLVGVVAGGVIALNWLSGGELKWFPVMASLPGPTATETPAPTPASRAAAVTTPTPTRAPTAFRTASPIKTRTELLREFQEYMLDLINEARRASEVPPVVLGDNMAAQLHAESSLANCFSSHWGIDGLKPYMRYALAGGYQSNGENVSGSDYCITAATRTASGTPYSRVSFNYVAIKKTMVRLMDSPGHRENILRASHRKVNIGMTWDAYNSSIVQHFEGDHVEYANRPEIDKDGRIELAGRVYNGVTLTKPTDLKVTIYYDPPPHELTRGQITRTYCYTYGRKVAALLPPGRYSADRFESTPKTNCPNPYDVAPDEPPPESPSAANAFHARAKQHSSTATPESVTARWVTASRWDVDQLTFTVKASIRDLLREWGTGVYTLVIRGPMDEGRGTISTVVLFHGITPPSTYTARKGG